MHFFKRSFYTEAPTGLVDLHCHSLFAMDDGAQNIEMMYQMIQMAYQDGIRFLCFTPHYNPAIFEYDANLIDRSFQQAQEYVAAYLPEMKLYRGNEVFFYHNTVEDLASYRCQTLNQTCFILVEFSVNIEFSTMKAYLLELLCNGYKPILAHVERYKCLYINHHADELYRSGILFQANVNTLFSKDYSKRLFLMQLMKIGYISVISDDCHNVNINKPGLSAGYRYIVKHFGQNTADSLFITNSINILQSKRFIPHPPPVLI